MLSPDEVGGMGVFYDEARPAFHWSYHTPYLQVSIQTIILYVVIHRDSVCLGPNQF